MRVVLGFCNGRSHDWRCVTSWKRSLLHMAVCLLLAAPPWLSGVYICDSIIFCKCTSLLSVWGGYGGLLRALIAIIMFELGCTVCTQQGCTFTLTFLIFMLRHLTSLFCAHTAWFLATGDSLSMSEQQLVDCSWDAGEYGNNGCGGKCSTPGVRVWLVYLKPCINGTVRKMASLSKN